MAVRQILLDTNAYAAFKRGLPDAVQIIRHVPLIALNSTVLGELLGRFAVGTREAKNRQELAQFLDSSRVRMFMVDTGTAEHYAVVYGNLKRKGRPIPTNDMWIAATAIQHDLILFSYDHHFEAIDGLAVGNHLTDFIA